MNNKYFLLYPLALTFLTGCHEKIPQPKYFNQFDLFQEELAIRSSKKIGMADDFKIIVTQVAYPIGTLMRAGSTIPIDYSACIPTSTPVAYAAPNLFPSYSLSKALAVDVGLDNNVIKKLLDLGVNVSASDKITFSVKGTSLQTLADTDLKRALNTPGCRDVIKGSSAWLVRGYVEGVRSFSLTNSNKATLKGNIEKIASFNVNGENSNQLSLTDDKTVGFLQIVSQVSIVADNTAPKFEKPTVQNFQGKTFIQQDRLDQSDSGTTLAKVLKAKKLNIMRVEKLPSSEMPNTAQVRFFNDGDMQAAQDVLSELRKYYSNAELKKVGLPAASGTLEVWLPRVR